MSLKFSWKSSVGGMRVTACLHVANDFDVDEILVSFNACGVSLEIAYEHG